MAVQLACHPRDMRNHDQPGLKVNATIAVRANGLPEWNSGYVCPLLLDTGQLAAVSHGQDLRLLMSHQECPVLVDGPPST